MVEEAKKEAVNRLIGAGVKDVTSYLSQIGFFDKPLGEPVGKYQSHLFQGFFEDSLTELVDMVA